MPALEAAMSQSPSQSQGWLRRQWSESPFAVIGGVGVLLIMSLTIFGGLLTPYDPIAQSLRERLQPPSWLHPFGTDNFGRDILSRLVHGGRNIFLLTGFATAISVTLGAAVGMLAGYVGGLVDTFLMRIVDALLALPALLLTLLLMGVFGTERWVTLLAIVILYVPIVARVARSATLDVRGKAYIEAAEAGGETRFYVLTREILPAIAPILAVEAALRFSYAIFLVASLGFLGLGVVRPEPDWGLMVSEARDWYTQAPHMLFFPATAIVVFVVCLNLMSDGLRRSLNYRAEQS